MSPMSVSQDGPSFPEGDRSGDRCVEQAVTGHKGCGLDFLNLEDSQARPPAMESKQRDVVRTHMLRERLTRSGAIEHATDLWCAIIRSGGSGGWVATAVT